MSPHRYYRRANDATSWIERMRYGICDLVDDLRGSRSYAETVATATQLYPEVANAFFRLNGLWSASRKAIPRRLQAVSPEMAKNFEYAFGLLFRQGDASAVILLGEDKRD